MFPATPASYFPSIMQIYHSCQLTRALGLCPFNSAEEVHLFKNHFRTLRHPPTTRSEPWFTPCSFVVKNKKQAAFCQFRMVRTPQHVHLQQLAVKLHRQRLYNMPSHMQVRTSNAGSSRRSTRQQSDDQSESDGGVAVTRTEEDGDRNIEEGSASDKNDTVNENGDDEEGDAIETNENDNEGDDDDGDNYDEGDEEEEEEDIPANQSYRHRKSGDDNSASGPIVIADSASPKSRKRRCIEGRQPTSSSALRRMRSAGEEPRSVQALRRVLRNQELVVDRELLETEDPEVVETLVEEVEALAEYYRSRLPLLREHAAVRAVLDEGRSL